MYTEDLVLKKVVHHSKPMFEDISFIMAKGWYCVGCTKTSIIRELILRNEENVGTQIFEKIFCFIFEHLTNSQSRKL